MTRAMCRTIEDAITAAGCRRDGCAVAAIEPTITMLWAMASTAASRNSSAAAREWAMASALRDAAIRTRMSCRVHDAAARGEIDAAQYADSLAELRAMDRRLAG